MCPECPPGSLGRSLRAETPAPQSDPMFRVSEQPRTQPEAVSTATFAGRCGKNAGTDRVVARALGEQSTITFAVAQLMDLAPPSHAYPGAERTIAATRLGLATLALFAIWFDPHQLAASTSPRYML